MAAVKLKISSTRIAVKFSFQICQMYLKMLCFLAHLLLCVWSAPLFFCFFLPVHQLVPLSFTFSTFAYWIIICSVYQRHAGQPTTPPVVVANPATAVCTRSRQQPTDWLWWSCCPPECVAACKSSLILAVFLKAQCVIFFKGGLVFRIPPHTVLCI